jgi:hypothetical protein
VIRFHKPTGTWRVGNRSYFTQDAAHRSLRLMHPRRRKPERQPGPVIHISPAEYEAAA